MADLSAQAEAKLAEAVGQYYADPLGFVLAMYPWGEPTLPDGSPNPLKNKRGPEPWQRRLLERLGAHIRENIERAELDMQPLVWNSARASGHGVGKSAVVAWIIQFLMATRRNTRGVVTANTGNQLETKTWPELAKWHRLIAVRHWFTWTATSYYFTLAPEAERKNYMVTASTVSPENTEAFAGLHNEGNTVFVIFDEASGIDSKIWEVATGAFTDGEGFFFVFGNPTQPTGPFADCFDKWKDEFDLEQIDSREVSHTNKEHIDKIIRMYGADSDEAKVRVYGTFPAQAYNGFIGMDAVEEAQTRELTTDPGAAIILAVDVARFGDDETVIGVRQGRDFRSRPMLRFKGLKTTRITEIVAKEADRLRPDAIVIESTGPGAGVIDQLRDRGYRVIEVHPGAMSGEPLHYYRKRDELWAKMRDWIIEEGCISDDPTLAKQLTTIQYTLDAAEQRTKLEAKEDYKKRTGLSSPDCADTLALTFAVRLARRDRNLDRRGYQDTRSTAISDYEPVDY